MPPFCSAALLPWPPPCMFIFTLLPAEFFSLILHVCLFVRLLFVLLLFSVHEFDLSCSVNDTRYPSPSPSSCSPSCRCYSRRQATTTIWPPSISRSTIWATSISSWPRWAISSVDLISKARIYRTCRACSNNRRRPQPPPSSSSSSIRRNWRPQHQREPVAARHIPQWVSCRALVISCSSNSSNSSRMHSPRICFKLIRSCLIDCRHWTWTRMQRKPRNSSRRPRRLQRRRTTPTSLSIRCPAPQPRPPTTMERQVLSTFWQPHQQDSMPASPCRLPHWAHWTATPSRAAQCSTRTCAWASNRTSTIWRNNSRSRSPMAIWLAWLAVAARLAPGIPVAVPPHWTHHRRHDSAAATTTSAPAAAASRAIVPATTTITMATAITITMGGKHASIQCCCVSQTRLVTSASCRPRPAS